MPPFLLRSLEDRDRAWAADVLRQAWGDTLVLSRGRIHQAHTLPGFITEQDKTPIGLVTYWMDGDALADLGQERPDIVVLDADLYKSTRSVVFAQKFPERFFDMGIAEQDMLSTAAGLAASGFVPYTNSFALFITARCYDQIRIQIAYPSLPVKIVGSSAGLTQGPDGASHQSLEDVSLMRGLPNMAVVVPADDVETRQATVAIADWPGPVYFRLGRYPTPRVFGKDYQFKVGKMATLRDGGDIVVFACGHMTAKALEAADLLAKDGMQERVVNVSTIKPFDDSLCAGGRQGL